VAVVPEAHSAQVSAVAVAAEDSYKVVSILLLVQFTQSLLEPAQAADSVTPAVAVQGHRETAPQYRARD
jgi:hypothetical protein